MVDRNAKGVIVEDWAGEKGEKWLANRERLESMNAPIGDALLSAANISLGDFILDVGCGAGGTTIALARTTGPKGQATGLDISPTLTKACAERATAAGVANVDFVTGDATVADVGKGVYDILFSRFGVMFFEDPVKAFTNLHSTLKPNAKAIFSCWAPAQENQWILEIMGCIARRIDVASPAPRAPGPFAFEEPDYVKEILTQAGFRGVDVSPWRGKQFVGGGGASAKEAADFVVNALSIGNQIKDQPERVRESILADMEKTFSRFTTPEGVAMEAKAWFVSAKAA